MNSPLRVGQESSAVVDGMRIRLLGGFVISTGTRTIEEESWRLRKARSIVALLALSPGHRMHRERLMDLLWPELDAGAAANNLHHALFVARRVLDPTASSRYLGLRDEQLALCPDDTLWVDVDAFEGAAARARGVRAPAAYRAVLELYGGELLPEYRYDEWAQVRRHELQTTYVALLAEMADIHEAAGEIGAATGALRKILEIEPAHEEAHVGLIRLCAAEQRYQALRQYERLEEILRRDLGAQPSTSSRRLYEEILTGRLPSARAPHRESPEETDAPEHNLPVALTSFIGREREVLEVESALGKTRLLTLTGAGGIGKTRLALEVARGLTYPQGVWLVELASISEPELVPRAVAAALEIYENPGSPLMDALVGALRTKRLLLVLDNCEHLVDDVAHLAKTLLNHCAGVRILATSREALGVAGETNWVVRSLSVPDPEHPAVVESESARLFVDRARHRQPDFELTQESARLIGRICRHLDGIPLAIELAAARLGVLALEQIGARIDDLLNLLTEGGRTSAPRQRTLRAMLDWSYELLEERERAVFARLSVFAGSWTLEAAEAVASGDEIEQKEILDLLSKLVYKSLVVAEASGEGALRYRMLAPVRQYAREKLGERAETALRQHANWCLDFARRAEREPNGPERLEQEHDNLRAALSWAIENEPELGLDLALSQQLLWLTRGNRGEGQRWLERAARGIGPTRRTHAKAEALCVAGHLGIYQGSFGKAKAFGEEALTTYRELEDTDGVAHALVVLGFAAALGQEDPDVVLALEEEVMGMRPEIKAPRIVASVLLFCGVAAVARDDWERAEALHEESLGLFRETRDALGASVCLVNLGLMAVEQADYERALDRFGESLRVTLESDKEAIMNALSFLAVATAIGGRPGIAARLWGATARMQEAYGIRLLPMPRRRLRHDERLAAARERLGEAAWEAAWAEGKAMSQREAIEYALEVAVKRDAPALTRREDEVACLISRGLSNRRIGEELGISERTVENHVARILRKLGCHSRTQIAVWAARHERLS